MPHEDGPAYERVVATVSLGGSLCLDLYEKKIESNGASREQRASEEVNGHSEHTAEEHEDVKRDADGRPIPSFRILQEPGSLLVTRGEAYDCLLHGISAIVRDVDLRKQTVANWDLLGDRSVFKDAGGVNERTTRVSLTYRDVLKVSKVGLGVLGKR